MTGDEDLDGLAGEYVLGTLDADERAAVAARRLREPALDAAIRGWENRLVPLIESVAEVVPSEDLFPKIESRIENSIVQPRSATIIDLRRQLNFWRGAAIATGTIAACLAIAIGAQQFRFKEKTPNLVAVLQKDAASPAFLVTVNVENRTMTVRPVAAKNESGKSYELWLVQESLGAPKSLGTIDEEGSASHPTLAAFKPDVIKSATYAVSLEPEGGSPTGQPTGPVLFAGKLIPAN